MSSLLRAWYVFLGLCLLTFILTAFVGQVPYTLSSALAPPGQLFFRLGSSFRAAFYSTLDRRDLRQENADLVRRTEVLETENRRLEVDLERLEQLLQVRGTRTPGAVMTAPVAEVSPSPIVRRVELSRGAAQGIRKNMPVTAPAGLVGVVADVTGRTASVRAITDPESAVGVTLRERGGQGVAVGIPGGRLRVTDFTLNEPVRLGDVVETSGRGGLFPRGLTVGTVVQVPPRNPNDLRTSFVIQPTVDPTLLLDVTLLEPL